MAPSLPHPRTGARPSLKAAVRTVQTTQHLQKQYLIREGKHAKPPTEMPPAEMPPTEKPATSAAAGSAAAGSTAGRAVRPSLKAAVRTVQTTQHLQKQYLIREGKHAKPPTEMPPTAMPRRARSDDAAVPPASAAAGPVPASLAAALSWTGTAAAGLAAAGVEAAGSLIRRQAGIAGVALPAGETRTVSDASSFDADGRPRLRRVRTQTDSSFVNLGTTIDSSQRIDPFMNLGSSEHQSDAPATQAQTEAPAIQAGAPATTEAWGV